MPKSLLGKESTAAANGGFGSIADILGQNQENDRFPGSRTRLASAVAAVIEACTRRFGMKADKSVIRG